MISAFLRRRTTSTTLCFVLNDIRSAEQTSQPPKSTKRHSLCSIFFALHQKTRLVSPLSPSLERSKVMGVAKGVSPELMHAGLYCASRGALHIHRSRFSKFRLGVSLSILERSHELLTQPKATFSSIFGMRIVVSIVFLKQFFRYSSSYVLVRSGHCSTSPAPTAKDETASILSETRSSHTKSPDKP